MSCLQTFFFHPGFLVNFLITQWEVFLYIRVEVFHHCFRAHNMAVTSACIVVVYFFRKIIMPLPILRMYTLATTSSSSFKYWRDCPYTFCQSWMPQGIPRIWDPSAHFPSQSKFREQYLYSSVHGGLSTYVILWEPDKQNSPYSNCGCLSHCPSCSF